MTGFVYFIKADDQPFVKVGYARDVAARLTSLQTGNPQPLKVLATIAGPPALERQIHRALGKLRASEWFKWEYPLSDIVTSLADGRVPPENFAQYCRDQIAGYEARCEAIAHERLIAGWLKALSDPDEPDYLRTVTRECLEEAGVDPALIAEAEQLRPLLPRISAIVEEADRLKGAA